MVLCKYGSEESEVVCLRLSAFLIDNIDVNDLYLVSEWFLEGSVLGDGDIARICLCDQ